MARTEQIAAYLARTMRHLDEMVERSRVSHVERLAAQERARDERRAELWARGEARAARGRLYEAIQLGGRR
jgi:hypothetical protein